jgi:hypothetical protein
MKPATAGEASVHIDADPDVVYALVSDVTRMGEWSPETYRCQWMGEGTGPYVGSRFKGYNRRGFARWSNKCEVVAAEQGREFAFRRTAPVFSPVVWRYQLENDGAGTRLVESYQVERPNSAIADWINGLLLRGVADRDDDLRAAMQATLERIKLAAEQSSS